MNFVEFWNVYIYPIVAILIPVLATIQTLNMRLKNENREKHQPYLVLDKIDNLFHFDENKYYFTFYTENDLKKANELKLEICLRNIGYGVATNVKFYNLIDGSQVNGCQKLNPNINQKLFTTFDIASKEARQVQLITRYNQDKYNFYQFLCVYQDLNFNVYKFMIFIKIKAKNKFDYFSYEPSSLSYKRMANESKKVMENILKDYKNL